MKRLKARATAPVGYASFLAGTTKESSQAVLAKNGRCSEGLVAQIETGRRQPGLINAINIAKALGVPLGAIAFIHVNASDVASVNEAMGLQPTAVA